MKTNCPVCHRLGLGVLGVAGALLAAVALRAGEPATPLKPGFLSVGFTRSSFLDVNPREAEAAFKLFTESIGLRRGYRITTEVTIFESLAECEKAIRETKVMLLVFDSWEYLTLNSAELLEPVFAPVENGAVQKEYLLLVRRDGPYRALADLKGRKIGLMEHTTANLSAIWISTLLASLGLPPADAFFGKVEMPRKPSAAVLPVFFGKSDACVVDRAGFEIMKELNPQVGKVLHAIAVSKPMMDSLDCLHTKGWVSEEFRQEVIKGLAELHTDPAGQQILTLFKSDRLDPFKPEFLDNVRELRAQHRGLVMPVTPTSAVSAKEGEPK